jgi:hypothetical protein
MTFAPTSRMTFLLPIAALSLMGCADKPRPTVRVGIGMTLAELISGSTYPFKQGLMDQRQLSDCAKSQGLSEHWTITQPYDLVFVSRGHELVRQGLGGPNFLLAITSSPSKCSVDAVGITFQDHMLSVNEVMDQAKYLEEWLSSAGFRPPTPMERKEGHFSEPFAVEQVSGAAPLGRKISNLSDARAAFVDQQSKVKKIVLGQFIGPNASADIWVENARRANEEITGHRGEEAADTEKEYFLYLDFSQADFRLR